MSNDYLTDDGERQDPKDQNWGYYANVSIYKFASQYCQDMVVLDAGCGLGYGAQFLIENGIKKVVGIDQSQKAINYDKKEYSEKNLEFLCHDLNNKLPFEKDSFDFIFTSNALEHIAQTDKVLAEFCRVLNKKGSIVIGIPPIKGPGTLQENLRNVYHISNFSILGWHTKLKRFFHDVTTYRHWIKQEWEGEDHLPKDIELPAEKTKIRENDFTLEKTPIEILKNQHATITAIFLANNPRQEVYPPHIDEFIPQSWSPGELYSKVRIEEEKKLKNTTQYWKSEYERVLKEQNTLRRYIDEKLSSIKKKIS